MRGLTWDGGRVKKTRHFNHRLTVFTIVDLYTHILRVCMYVCACACAALAVEIQ